MDKNRLAVDEWEARLARKIEALAEETDYFESDYPDPADDVRGHPFNGGRTFFDLNPRERLDVLYALGEERLEDDPEGECGAEVRAMAVHNATFADAEEEGHHPEAHGDPIGVDSDNRQYFACGNDLRVYRWEKPKANAFTQPAWGTVCVGLKETMAFADSLKGGKRNSKDYLLWEYLTETHLPPHVAVLEREDRAKRAEEKALEDAERRRAAKEAYESVDRKRSGRIAQKAAEEEEKRRIEEEASAKREALRAAAAAKETRGDARRIDLLRIRRRTPSERRATRGGGEERTRTMERSVMGDRPLRLVSGLFARSTPRVGVARASGADAGGRRNRRRAATWVRGDASTRLPALGRGRAASNRPR